MHLRQCSPERFPRSSRGIKLTNNDVRPTFVDTRQHQRFVEFCESCRLNRYIGVCTGRSGVGKTRSAETYSKWSVTGPLLIEPRHRNYAPPNLAGFNSAIYTPDVSCTVTRVESAIKILRNRFDKLIESSLCWHNPQSWYDNQKRRFLEVLIIDKAQRLSIKCLEAICDFAEEHKLGIVLLGMPGFDRRIRNYDQINNLVGFYHIFNTPRTDELRAILEARWQRQQVTIEDGAIEMLEKVTNSNIRKLVNINAEMSRVCELNSISIITPELVQLASKTLLLDTK